MKEKLIQWTRDLFAYGMSILVVAALLVAAVFVVLFVIGMPASGAVIAFLRAHILPVIYVAAIILSFVGIFNMYLRGEEIYKLDIPKRKN